MNPEALIPALVVLPMLGFLVTAVVGRRLGKQAHWVPVIAIFAVWVVAMVLVVNVLSGAAPLLPGSEDSHGYVVDWFTWIPADNFVVNVGFVVDALTACLLIVVTTIGLLVHVYSIGYMSHDPGYWRFFAYLNLFMFSMLLLVLAGNFLVVFVAWELVGLCELPADRLLVPQALGGARGQEGVHRQPRRRRRFHPRDHADLRQPRHARHPRGHRADR